jgi:predicted nucleic acid-binding protein
LASYVVDVNVVLKWRLVEVLSAEARFVRTASDTRLLAPRFLLVEAANVLAFKVSSSELSREDAVEFQSGIPRLVELTDDSVLLRRAFDISHQYRASVYDSLYLALALSTGCRLITADDRFLRLVRPAFPDTLLWLGDVTVDSL